MSYTLIKGSFHIFYPESPLSGPEPDGDTIKFQPDHKELITALPKPNQPASFNRDGITSIRFEGIDTLETHFDVGGDEYHQHMGLALAARDRMLALAGFGQVKFREAPHQFKVESVQNHPIRGHILTNGLDTYGRTIAFVFVGEHPAIDGTQVFVTPQMLDASLNLQLLGQGHAYPAFYLTLPADLREHLHGVTVGARRDGLGLWPQATATTTEAAQVGSLAALESLVMWPKLFRRLAPYLQEGHTDFAALDAWLRADPRNRDDRLLLPNRELGNMHDMIVEQGDAIRLAWQPEDVVIVPDDYVLEQPPAPPPPIRAGTGDLRVVAALIDALGNERGQETVTLLNTTAAAIDLAGWHIADGTGQQALAGELASGEAMRVTLTSSVQLSNVRDTITVIAPNGDLIDQVSYQARELPGPGRTRVF